mgnify:CR=1 FL=1
MQELLHNYENKLHHSHIQSKNVLQSNSELFVENILCDKDVLMDIMNFLTH